jgi:D-alanyl-D-alanine carboxypeptidase
MRYVAVLIGLLLLVGLRAEAARSETRISAAIEAYIAGRGFNGTILVVDQGREILHSGFGLADRSFAVPADRNTRYRVASITKLFTAVLVLQLQQEGRLRLDDVVRRHLPDFPGEGGGRITIRQLLNHTSGLRQFDAVASYQEAFAKGMSQYQRPLSPSELLTLCCAGASARAAGEAFDYNNADYIVLGRIIERLTGQSYEDALAARILRPLGLGDTGMMRWDRPLERLAPSYFFRDDTNTLINDMPVYWENWYAAGGMYSTTSNLRVFAEALYGGRLLDRASLEALLTPGLDDYGLGLWSYSFERGGRRWRVAKRPGSIMGANSVLFRLIDRDATIILLANTNRTDLDAFAQRIAELIVE